MTIKEPWALVKNGDMDAAAGVLNECFQMIDLFARVSAPFMPDTATKIQNIFGKEHDLSWPTKYEHRIADSESFVVPDNLFARIDDDTVAAINEKYSAKQPTVSPIVAKVIDIKNHSDRDDLHILTVDTGTEKLQVVCGAPNVHKDMIGVFAPVGCVLPNSKKPLTARNVAGVKSFGMMCSAAELGINGDAKQIIELAADTEIGTEYNAK